MINLLVGASPTTCFGESLKAGTMRLAEFLVIKSVMLSVIFIFDTISSIEYAFFEHSPFFEEIVFSILLCLLSIAKVGFNVALYYGARNGKPSYMKPWFWVYTVQTVLLILGGVGGSLAMNFFAYRSAAIPSAFVFILVLIYCTVSRYFCSVVLGLIREMERGYGSADSVRPVAFNNEEVA